MNAEAAFRVIGRANAQEPFLSNMIRALGMMSVLNTREENERLEAAKWVKRHKVAYRAYCQSQLDRRSA